MRLAADDQTVDEPELSDAEWTAREAARRVAGFGEILARQRLARRMPVARLAAVTGVPVRVIRDLEAGAPTDVGHAILLAEALGLDLLTALRRAAAATLAPIELENDEALPAPGD
ncbi:helix-turn-helix transcriptional regulator [Methylobacterium ajmalii]|uniref:Helix-turn-helix transcriptional regulator n=1 Tax=Methylobacterium ajmalii TaxID=2738439 RepID=A0ABV0A0T2_9HYPH|nr:helix-turn-helix transcriptional regulator [Methylobacterium aquaticum]